MKRTILALTIAGITLGIGTQAHGYVLTIGGTEVIGQGRDTSVANATKNNFNEGPLPPGYFGGAFAVGNTIGISIAPTGDQSRYWAVGPDHNNDVGEATFSTPLSYFGFDWSTPDSYNFLRLYRDDTLLAEFTGDSINKIGGYVNINAVGADLYFNKIQFSSPGFNAFETDNHAWVTAAVPEPSTYAMLVAGLAVLGGITRRRLASAE